MKAITTLTALFLCLASCKDMEDPPKTLEERLQGAWQRRWIVFENTYYFDRGLCVEHSIIPGQPVQEYFKHYTCQGDTLRMVDLASASEFRDTSRAIVEFPTDTTCVLGFVGGFKYFLKRI